MPAAPLVEPRSYPRGVTCWHSLPDGLSDLAAEVVAIMGVPKRMLAADFRQLVRDRDSPFPRDMSRSMRSLRLSRLLEQPVRVGEVLLRMETRERRHIYDKTQTLVTERAELPPAPVAVGRPEATPTPARTARAIANGDEVVTLLRAVLACLESIDRRISGGAADTASAAPVALTATSSAPPAASSRPVSDGLDPAVPQRPRHFRFCGRELSRPLYVLRVLEVEENLAALSAALGTVPVGRGALAEPEFALPDCARRAARVLRELAALTRVVPETEAYAPDAADLGDLARWDDLGSRLMRAGQMLNRVAFARPELGFEPRAHPELAEPG